VFERGRLADTSGVVWLDEFGLDSVDRQRYEPSRWLYLRRALKGVRIQPTDVFADIGSGMGRVVFQAARYPFARVIGVEIAEELTKVARENIEHNTDRLRARKVEFVAADAAEYEVPDDLTYAYFHNPFSGETFRRVIGHIVESLDRAPRRFTLIYVNPVEEAYVLQTGRFDRRRLSKGIRRDLPMRWVAIYEAVLPRER
jgi:hypothetical protein